jgi:hypothetical protein
MSTPLKLLTLVLVKQFQGFARDYLDTEFDFFKCLSTIKVKWRRGFLR